MTIYVIEASKDISRDYMITNNFGRVKMMPAGIKTGHVTNNEKINKLGRFAR
jgi:hypothetical protein